MCKVDPAGERPFSTRGKGRATWIGRLQDIGVDYRRLRRGYERCVYSAEDRSATTLTPLDVFAMGSRLRKTCRPVPRGRHLPVVGLPKRRTAMSRSNSVDRLEMIVHSGCSMIRREFLQLGMGALGAAAFDALSPSLARAAASNDEEKLYAEARKEGKVVWWTAHYALSAAEAVRNAFVAKYPGIEVEFIRQTAQVIYQ